MQSQTNQNTQDSNQAKRREEDIHRGADAVDEMWSRMVEQGDDHYHEVFNNGIRKESEELVKPKASRGRKI